MTLPFVRVKSSPLSPFCTYMSICMCVLLPCCSPLLLCCTTFAPFFLFCHTQKEDLGRRRKGGVSCPVLSWVREPRICNRTLVGISRLPFPLCPPMSRPELRHNTHVLITSLPFLSFSLLFLSIPLQCNARRRMALPLPLSLPPLRSKFQSG